MADLATGESVSLVLPASAWGCDTETFAVEKALQAPPMVCGQYGDVSGKHEVILTSDLGDLLREMFRPDREMIWFHNGPFDLAVILEWYPQLAEFVWLALAEGRIFDTMYLARLIQIATGTMGPLGLDLVTQQYGIRPPTKEIQAEHPDFPGRMLDVRTSFGLWYMADEIPDPWFSYADYDGEVMLPLAARMVKRACTGDRPLVPLHTLATITRTQFCLGLSRTYGLRVRGESVKALQEVARVALTHLREAAQVNGFLKPKRPDRKKGTVAHPSVKFCPVQYATKPSARQLAKHATCPGCVPQGVDPRTNELTWSKDTVALKKAVTLAYEGNPPLTEPTKKKVVRDDGSTAIVKSGGGQVATARHVLQDSGNEELDAWSQYNEYAALMAKDMPIFARGIVHSRIGIAASTRPTSSDPNVLNFRRTSFYLGVCPNPECGFEMALDAREMKKGTNTIVLCPACECETTELATT